MPVYNGIDIIEISRIQKVLSSHGEAFLKKVFTPREIDYCESRKAARFQCYAARFAAKEAVSKALGTGICNGIKWTDIEVVTNENGTPCIILSEKALERFISMNGKNISISLSHSKDYAVASAVLETE